MGSKFHGESESANQNIDLYKEIIFFYEKMRSKIVILWGVPPPIYGSMSFVWSQNDHVLDYFFHRGKLWSVGHSALVPEELGTLWGAAGSLWEL